MIRIGIALAFMASLGVILWFGIDMVRKDAQADLLRQLQIQQAEREEQDVNEREARKKEIENATPDELRTRACLGGMLPPDTCP